LEATVVPAYSAPTGHFRGYRQPRKPVETELREWPEAGVAEEGEPCIVPLAAVLPTSLARPAVGAERALAVVWEDFRVVPEELRLPCLFTRTEPLRLPSCTTGSDEVLVETGVWVDLAVLEGKGAEAGSVVSLPRGLVRRAERVAMVAREDLAAAAAVAVADRRSAFLPLV